MDDKHAVLKGPEPLYRLTFKDEDGTTSTFESVGSNLPTVVANQSGASHFVKVERIDRVTGEVMRKSNEPKGYCSTPCVSSIIVFKPANI
jgi:hypothetical protein